MEIYTFARNLAYVYVDYIIWAIELSKQIVNVISKQIRILSEPYVYARPKWHMGRARASLILILIFVFWFQEIYRIEMDICFSSGLNLLKTNLRFG